MAKFDDDFIQYNDQKVKEEKSKLAFYLFTHITLYIFLIFFAIFFIWYTVFTATHKYYVVRGASMKDTLNASLSLTDSTGTEDAVYVDTMSKVRLYDIIVIEKEAEDRNVVKRMMAFEGDYVSISIFVDESGTKNLFFYRIAEGTDLSNFSDEMARVDESSGENGYTIYSYSDWTNQKGRFLDQTSGISYEEDFYLQFLVDDFPTGATAEYDTERFFISDSGMIYVKVPEDKFFCLGDNRGHSADSREYGFYDVSQIVGRVEIIVRNHSFVNRLWVVVRYYFAEVEDFFAR